MFRKIYLSVVLLSITTLAFAQTGTLKGVITDAMTGEPIPFANIVAERNGNQIGGTTTDFDGNYTIKPLEPGNYTVKATFVGYGAVEITGVVHESCTGTGSLENLNEYLIRKRENGFDNRGGSVAAWFMVSLYELEN